MCIRDSLGGGHHGGALGLFAVSHQTVQVALGGQTAQLLVCLAAQVAQLQHIAQ